MTPRLRNALIALVILAALGVGLLLDLSNRGQVWRLFYALTGEETPAAQLIGVLQWSGRWFRAQPQTAPLTPMDHVGEVPFGANVFLEQEVEVAKRERILQMLSDAGFVWLRQEFPWEDIEISGRGDFDDCRNDLNGDGTRDSLDCVSAWAKYDNIVDLAEQYDMRLQVRLSNPPSWTHADPALGTFAPPDDIQDYVNYARTVAQRYAGRITHYQIWNEPNIYPEWGNQDANPEAYTQMLCQTYDALKAVDPEIVVISGALAPTNAMGGADLNDFIFLQRMLDAGAADCFDVLSMQGYGLNSAPSDRRMRPQTVTFARPIYIRDLLVRNGHPEKPIWISEAAWNPVPEPEEVPNIDARYNFGQVSEEQAARYMVEGYARMQREWNWSGVMFYWFFKRPADYEQNQSFYYFRMVEPDFTPLPVYDALRDYITTQTPTLYAGTHQEDHWALTFPAEAQVIQAAGAQFGDAIQTSRTNFIAHGTEVTLRWQGNSPITVYRDGRILSTIESGDALVGQNGWMELRVRLGWFAEDHPLQIESAAPFTLDSVTVYDNTVSDILILLGMTVLVIGLIAVGVFSVGQRQA